MKDLGTFNKRPPFYELIFLHHHSTGLKDVDSLQELLAECTDIKEASVFKCVFIYENI